MKIRHIALWFASVLVLASGVGAASAADLAVKAPPAPPAVPGYAWSGLYAGLNAGGSWGNSSDTFNTFVPGTPALTGTVATDHTRPTGAIGGGQVGYNAQLGSFVLGIETDIQGAWQRATASTPCNPAVCLAGATITNTDRLTWFGTARGRAGVAWGNWLAYVTGGPAYGGIHTRASATLPGFAPTGALGDSGSTTRPGGAIGGGVEAALTGNWTWKVEYLYLKFAHATFSGPISAPFPAGSTVTQTLNLSDNIVRGGVNLRF